ncbi:MAG: hypothetical protein HY517_04240, partial [Candidatus Aenigmarchaeota archaeon]|nr:hypothetical protein [Candidatus Aenigmarchaeota archaeon]
MTLEYLGRLVVDLNADDGAPAAAFGVMVRTPKFKARKFYPRGDRLYMGPLVEGSEPQIDNAENLFYNTMLTRDGVLIVTNGQHTDARFYSGKHEKVNFEDTFMPKFPLDTSELIMQIWGYEQDPMNTPRIALVSYPNFRRTSLFAIANKHNGGTASGAIVHSAGNVPRGLSTYKIVDGKAVARSIANSGEIHYNLVDVPISGNTAQDLADSFFNEMHPDLVVASAGAVFRDSIW